MTNFRIFMRGLRRTQRSQIPSLMIPATAPLPVMIRPGVAALATVPLSNAPCPPIPSLHGTSVQAASNFAVAANFPIEDRHIVSRLGEDMLIAIVADGHGGWQCADFVKSQLVGAVAAELEHGVSYDDPQLIGAALSRAFERIDRDFLGRIRPAFQLGFGPVSSVGACTLAAVVTRTHIIVANAGDCRAVLGRSITAQQVAEARQCGDGSEDRDATELVGGGSSAWVSAQALSDDHNCSVPREQAQLRIAHPGESDVFVEKRGGACYVKGR